MLHVETVKVGGLLITEVGGGGAVRPTLYRGYLDLRSGLEIRALDWSVQWHWTALHTTSITTEITTIKQIYVAHCYIALLADIILDLYSTKCHRGLLMLEIFLLHGAPGALKVFCHSLNKQRRWWPLLNCKELSEILDSYITIIWHCETVRLSFSEWEIWCYASIWVLMVVRSSEVACPQIFPDGLTVHCTDKAGHCLIFFIVIISLSPWPSCLVAPGSSSNSESEMLSVDLICVISAAPSSPVLTSRNIKVSLKVLFCPGAQREGRNVKGIQCVMFALCEPSQSLRLITCVGLSPSLPPTPNSRRFMQKILVPCDASCDRALATS